MSDVIFSWSELPLFGVVCHPQLLISEVCHYSREPFIMQIYLHGTDVLYSFLTDIVCYYICIT